MAIGLLQSLFQKATASGWKSTGLSDLTKLIALLVAAFMFGPRLGMPPWALYLLASALVLVVLVFLGIYIYFARKSPELLRSERFTLSKLAIEKNLIGDDIIGLIEHSEEKPPRKVPPKEGE